MISENMNKAQKTVKSVLRIEFEREALPHLEALRRTSLWLTLRGSNADELVLKTVTRAYRSWPGSVDTIAIKLWLFRFLTRLFFYSENRRRREGRLLSEGRRTSADSDDNGRSPYALLTGRELVLLTNLPNMAVKGAIARLNSLSRLILILLLREKFSYAEIAYVTDLSKDSVTSIVSRLHRQIPRYLVTHAGSFIVAADDRISTHEDMASNEFGRPQG